MQNSINPQTIEVNSFEDLISTEFQNQCNAICWNRILEGNFKEIVEKLTLHDAITEVSINDLQQLELSLEGQLARNIIIKDLQLLTDFGAQPSLNLLQNYDRDTDFDFISTDVYSFHVDRSPQLMDTYLCTYYGASSDIIANDQALQKILIPEVRQQLRDLHNGSEETFEEFLVENFFDLHYTALPNAKITNLGVGHLWRLAVDHPDQKVLPCIHRAPIEHGELRLILIC